LVADSKLFQKYKQELSIKGKIDQLLKKICKLIQHSDFPV